MKKLTLILAIVMVLSMIAALPTSAAKISSTEIKKGTPVIDGFYDEIYGQSSYYQFEESDIGVVYASYDYVPDHNAMANFLWDDDYFYMFVTVLDTDVTTHGQEYIEANGTGSWVNDAVETWFFMDETYSCVVDNDAFGYTMFCVGSTNGSTTGATPAELFDTKNSKYVAFPTSSGYTIEVAFKLADEYKGLIAEGKSMGFSLQLNDIVSAEAADAGEIYCSGGQCGSAEEESHRFTFSAEEVVAVVEEPAAEVSTEEAPAAEAPITDITPAPVAPVTADAGIIAAVAVMAIAAGVILSKKH